MKLSELKKLSEAATPGPWRVIQYNGFHLALPPGSFGDCYEDENDAWLAAAARNHLDALLEVAEGARDITDHSKNRKDVYIRIKKALKKLEEIK